MATFTRPLTVTQARELGSSILTEQGFERGVRGHDVATWSHSDGRVGRLIYSPDFDGDPELVVRIGFQPPRTGQFLPDSVPLAELER